MKWPWESKLDKQRKRIQDDQTKEEVERRLTLLESQVRVLNERAKLARNGRH